MSATRTYAVPGTNEKRRDRRLQIPTLEVAFNGQVFHSANWSLGGVLLTIGNEHELTPGTAVAGIIRESHAGSFEFLAEVVRVASEGNEVALRFEHLDEAAFQFFDRCLTRILAPPRHAALT